MSICLNIWTSIYLDVYLSEYVPWRLFVYISEYLDVHLSICLNIWTFTCLICLNILIFTCLNICMYNFSEYLDVYLSLCLNDLDVYLSVCLNICLNIRLYIRPFVWISGRLFVYCLNTLMSICFYVWEVCFLISLCWPEHILNYFCGFILRVIFL